MSKEQQLLAFLYEIQEDNKNSEELSKALNELVKELEIEIQNSQLIPLV
jgi:hypothetical protein